MMKVLALVGAAVALVVTLGTPANAEVREWGRITGLGAEVDPRSLPCQAEGVRDGVGVMCFAKRSGSWTIEQPAGCSYKVDASTGFTPWSDCVRSVSDGGIVRVWSYRGAFDEYFEIVWH